ncbi:flagellin [Methylopila henanensis]|uniref:Flagellin n=1 Tax=Methylopila henanensis TaxID=873516 RepID=A0ABW4K8E8_9HYPH
MSDITLNSAVRSNLRTLQSTTDLMARTEERLSTGKKVNSALDNPSSFFTAQALDRRASDLTNLLDSVSNSVKTIEAADNGISAISDLVTQMKSVARSAQQSSSAVSAKAGFTSAAIAGATAENLLGTGTAATATTLTGVGNVAATYTGGTLSINGTDVTIADDSDADAVKAAIDAAGITGLTVTNTGGTLGFSLASGEDLTLSASTAALADNLGLSAAGGTDTDVTSTNGTAAANDLTGKTLTVKVGEGQTGSITFGTGAGQVSTLADLNTALSGYNAKATISSTGQLTIETTNEHGSSDLTIGGTAVSTDGTPAAGEIFGLSSTAAATKSAVLDGDGKSRRTDYKNDYNDLRQQIAQLAKDASYNGVNLLAGDDLSVVFNEDGSSKLDVSGVDLMDRLGLSDISFEDFADSSKIEEVVSKLNDALGSLDSLSSRLGSQLSVVETRQSFTKAMVGTLEDGALSLVGADTNEEAANLATLQTRQSLIVSSLSISTSQEQNVLQLLR